MTKSHFFIAPLLLIATQAPAQQLPQLDPAVQLGICQAMRARFLSDSEQAQTYVNQFMTEIADLKKKLAEAEAKLSPAPPSQE